MEMTTVKSESGLRRGDELDVAKCVKRRRRDPSAVTPGCSKQQGEQQNKQVLLQADQSNITAIVTTMKRSSRFRGVSRLVHIYRKHISSLWMVSWSSLVFFFCDCFLCYVLSADIDGQGGLKLIYGTKGPGM